MLCLKRRSAWITTELRRGRHRALWHLPAYAACVQTQRRVCSAPGDGHDISEDSNQSGRARPYRKARCQLEMTRLQYSLEPASDSYDMPGVLVDILAVCKTCKESNRLETTVF